MLEYRCPKCHGPLSGEDDEFVCAACCSAWPIRYGVPHFGDSSFFWGFVEEGRMSKILACAEQQSWEEAVRQVSSDRPDGEWFYRYLTDEQRASWTFLTRVSTQSRVLDIGSGWGAVAFGLARAVKEVVAFDATPENLYFIDIRRKQMDVRNVHPVQGDLINYPYLPFPDDYFDAVSMIGVLEWVGDATGELDPRQVQLRVLKKVRTAIKPGGCLYLAIENRFGYPYFLGKRDEHSGLRFATILPRWLANWYSWHVRRKPYRVYTHSCAALEKLVLDAGFTRLNLYCPVAGYQMPRYFLDLDSTSLFKYFVDHMLRTHRKGSIPVWLASKVIGWFGWQRHLCPVFAVVAWR